MYVRALRQGRGRKRRQKYIFALLSWHPSVTRFPFQNNCNSFYSLARVLSPSFLSSLLPSKKQPRGKKNKGRESEVSRPRSQNLPAIRFRAVPSEIRPSEIFSNAQGSFGCLIKGTWSNLRFHLWKKGWRKYDDVSYSRDPDYPCIPLIRCYSTGEKKKKKDCWLFFPYSHVHFRIRYSFVSSISQEPGKKKNVEANEIKILLRLSRFQARNLAPNPTSLSPSPR